MIDTQIRYTKFSDIIDLLMLMAEKPLGVTINDIKIRYCVSRRTAIRMRDCLLNVLPQIDEIETTDKCKHWGFIDYSMPIIKTKRRKNNGKNEITVN